MNKIIDIFARAYQKKLTLIVIQTLRVLFPLILLGSFAEVIKLTFLTPTGYIATLFAVPDWLPFVDVIARILGTIRPGDNEPIIVVGFENNHDGYDNIKQQARRFALAFEDLNEQYNFNNFKAIGHSNGGLIYTEFLEKYYPEYAQQVTLKRLMTIGTPYNFNEGSMQHKTQMLTDFIKERKKLPTELVMYSVAGSQTYNADGSFQNKKILKNDLCLPACEKRIMLLS